MRRRAKSAPVHPTIFAEFEEICARRGGGGDVLEIGAVPATDTLLMLPCLREARSRVGVNPEGPSRIDGITIVRARGNDLSRFADGSFDTVLCNSVLEHEPRFWEVLNEARRVLRPGGLLVIGVPGFVQGSLQSVLPAPCAPAPPLPAWVEASTPVLAHHEAPIDCYRFSTDAVTRVFMAGMRDVELRAAMMPPRIIASGFLDSERQPLPAESGATALDALAHLLAPYGPPIVVFNKSHSGSRLLTRVLQAAGVFMGAHLNDSGDSLDVLRLVNHCIDFHLPETATLLREGDPALPRLVEAVFKAHLEGWQPGQPWGWKLCETHYALPVIARLFPRARFVHLVRDGRDVAFSNFMGPVDDRLRKMHFGTEQVRHWRGLPLTPAAYAAHPHVFNARLWVAAVTDARARGQMLGDRYVEIRYEDLVTRFPETVSRLFTHLGLGGAADVAQRLIDLPHITSVGRFRKADPARLAEALAVLGPTLSAFGYGDESLPFAEDPTALSVIVFDDGDDTALAATLDDLRHLAVLAPEIVVVSARTQPTLEKSCRHVQVAADAPPSQAALSGARAARGAYLVFTRSGSRFTPDGLSRVWRMALREHAAAAVGRVRHGAAGQLSPLVIHADGLAHCDALPMETVVVRAPEAMRALSRLPETFDPTLWHWWLILQSSRDDLIIFTPHEIGRIAREQTPRVLPVMPAAPASHASSLEGRRLCVYGPPGASLELLLMGLPEPLRRLTVHVPQISRDADLAHLVHASAIVVLREFARPTIDGTFSALGALDVPLYYLTDDHLPTLHAEMPWAFPDATDEMQTRFLALTEGAFGASPALVEAMRPHARSVGLWAPVLDEDLVNAALEAAAAAPPSTVTRVGVMGGEFRAADLNHEVLDALRHLSRERPLEVVAREGLLALPNGLSCVEISFDTSFRRFVHRWRRERLTAVVHPAARTANAPYKNANALLVALYLGAVPIVSRHDPAYADLPDGCGALVVGRDAAEWLNALRRAADPDEARTLRDQLRVWCGEAFSGVGAAESLRSVLAAAPPVSAEEAAARWARTCSANCQK